MKQKDFYELAAQMEKECGDWQNSDGLSKRAISELLEKVEAMDAKESRRGAEEVKRFRRKKRYLFVLAAALVLMLGMGVVGDRAWIMGSSDLERESEITTKINNEEKESILLEEETIYQEIADKLGIVPMRLGYIPEGMLLEGCTIMENTGCASIIYSYNDSIVTIKMTKATMEVSNNVQWDGSGRKLEISSESYETEAYCIDEENHNYAANITYGNGYYSIFGVFSEDEEFLEILSKIYFKKL